MNTPEDANKTVQGQWRNLGFFYERKDDDRIWCLMGSKAGLSRFHDILVDYTNDLEHAKASAHEHYGPYMYLEIMTWEEAGIDGHSIHGNIEDLKRLAEIFAAKLKRTPIGDDFVIGSDYVSNVEYSLMAVVKEDDFDPAELDTAMK